jgi:hypothetical protein
MTILRGMLCDVDLDMRKIIPDLVVVVDDLTPEIRADLYKCVGFQVSYVLQQIFCVKDAEDNYKTLINYVLYMAKCSYDNTEYCSVLLFFLEQRKYIMRIGQLFGCAPIRKKRQYSIINTLKWFQRISCEDQNEWVAKIVNYINDKYMISQIDDIYGKQVINWTFIDRAVPPFFCCITRAAYKGL